MAEIFRAYDIRGIFGKDLTQEIMRKIGIGTGYFFSGPLVLGRDVRTSSPVLRDAFVDGYIATGNDVIDLGVLPIGAGAWYAWKLGMPYAYITASHLGPEWNGVKLFHPGGLGVEEDELKLIKKLSDRSPAKSAGRVSYRDIKDLYLQFLLEKFRPQRHIRIGIDCGNGAASLLAPKLFEKAGFEVTSLNCQPDGRFPGRSPDPTKVELKELKHFRLGIAYDGDGDRMVIYLNGRKLKPEEVAALLLEIIMKRKAGPVVANLECGFLIEDLVEKYRQKLYRCRVGHTWMLRAVRKHKAVFGVEASGHYIVPEIFPFDDGIATSYFLACYLPDLQPRGYPSERIDFPCPDEEKFRVVERLKKKISGGKMIEEDGIRIEWEDAWILLRASNTSPLIRLTIEARSEERLEELKKRFVPRVQEEIKMLRTK